MAHRVYTGAEPVQAPHPLSVIDRVGIQPYANQLLAGDHSMLSGGESGDPLVGKLTIGGYSLASPRLAAIIAAFRGLGGHAAETGR